MFDNLNKVLPQSPGAKTFLAIGGAFATLLVCLVCLLLLPIGLGGATSTQTGTPTAGNSSTASVEPSSTASAEPGSPETIELSTPILSLTEPALPTITPAQTDAIPTTPTGTQVPAASNTPCLVAISGTVYDDLNANRSRDANEPGLSGTVVNLQDASGATVAVGLTDAVGAYRFTNLPFGAFRLQVLAPPGWAATTPTPISVSISACGGFSNLDFGLTQTVLPPPPTTPAPTIITATPPPTNTFTPTPRPTSTFTPTPSPTIGFMVTGVVASVTPTSRTTCPGRFDFSATITVNQPGTVMYRWERSDGSSSVNQTRTFPAAGSQTVTDVWTVSGAPGFTYNGWERVNILAPNSLLSNQAGFTLICPPPTVITPVLQ